MKKLLVTVSLVAFTLCVSADVITSMTYDYQQQDSELVLAVDDEDMEVVKNTKAWYWSGNYMTNWMSCDAKIGRNKRDGSYWVKIYPPMGSPLVCPVEENPDYDGGWSGGRRTVMTHMATCGPTYYFDM